MCVKVCLTAQEVRQTDMSLTLNILQTLGVQPPPLHWLCDSYFPHPSGSYWEAGQAACSHTGFSERRLAPLRVSLTPAAAPFSLWPLFTHSVNVHVYKQLIVSPWSSGASEREETQTRQLSGSFSLLLLKGA